ncbi:hypothetical protein JD969_01155 [Planctomycetota bacterium]|nr:hypothetical protein JD969_01155 [Planctomycetota bacterium]
MVQKNFDIDRALSEQFSQFCKERGMTLGSAISAAILNYINMSAEEREQANLNLSTWLSNHGLEQNVKHKRAAKPLGNFKGKRL